MKQEKITLSIKDLALLKSNPQEYYKRYIEEEKTHDGTSLGQIGPVLDNWGGHGSTYRDECAAFDENGKKIFESENKNRKSADILKEKSNSDTKDIHFISTFNLSEGSRAANISEGSPGHELNIPSPEQLSTLLLKNENGDYMLRSYSLVSTNKSRVSVLRNNKFDKSNHKDYRETCKDLKRDSKKYGKDITKLSTKYFNEIVKEKYPAFPDIKDNEYYQILSDSAKMAIAEHGTWEQNVLIGKGYDKRFENCNTKIRISRKNTR